VRFVQNGRTYSTDSTNQLFLDSFGVGSLAADQPAATLTCRPSIRAVAGQLQGGPAGKVFVSLPAVQQPHLRLILPHIHFKPSAGRVTWPFPVRGPTAVEERAARPCGPGACHSSNLASGTPSEPAAMCSNAPAMTRLQISLSSSSVSSGQVGLRVMATPEFRSHGRSEGWTNIAKADRQPGSGVLDAALEPEANPGLRVSRQFGERQRRRSWRGALWCSGRGSRVRSTARRWCHSGRSPLPTPWKSGRVTVRCSRRALDLGPRNGSQALTPQASAASWREGTQPSG